MHKTGLAPAGLIDHNSKVSGRMSVHPCQNAIVCMFHELFNTGRNDEQWTVVSRTNGCGVGVNVRGYLVYLYCGARRVAC